MKVLHVQSSIAKGGAYVATDRIIAAQKTIDKDVITLTDQVKFSSGSKGYRYSDCDIRWRYTAMKTANAIKKICRFPKDTTRTFGVFPSPVASKVQRSCCDLVNFHWFGNELISIAQLNKMEKKWVATLHDLWLVQGINHIPIQNSQNIFLKYLDDLAIQYKRKALFKKLNLIAPSQWVADRVTKTAPELISNICVIPHPIDTTFWKPGNQLEARKRLGIKNNNLCILTSAVGGRENKLKGISKIFEVAKMVAEHKTGDRKVNFLIVGGEEHFCRLSSRVEIKNIPYTQCEEALRNLYRASDVYLSLSESETFGLTIQEAHSCGIPTISLTNIGSSEQIIPGINGYLLKSADVKKITDIINNLKYIIENLNQHKISEMAHDENGYEQIAEKYFNFYDKVLANSAS